MKTVCSVFLEKDNFWKFLKLVFINCTTHRDAQDDRFWEKVEEKIRAKEIVILL
jgi:hypothetical protein